MANGAQLYSQVLGVLGLGGGKGKSDLCYILFPSFKPWSLSDARYRAVLFRHLDVKLE